MKDQLISKRTALLAKEVGFSVKTDDWFIKSEDVARDGLFLCELSEKYIVRQPTQTLLTRWLRKKYGIDAYCDPILVGKKLRWVASIRRLDRLRNDNCHVFIDNGSRAGYEAALEIALYHAIKEMLYFNNQ